MASYYENGYLQGVVFILERNGQILIEHRKKGKLMENYLPSGKIEDFEVSKKGNYHVAAMKREIKEEWQGKVSVQNYKYLGKYRAKDAPIEFYGFMITRWKGNVPAYSVEDGKKFAVLEWIPIQDYLKHQKFDSAKYFIEKIRKIHKPSTRIILVRHGETEANRKSIIRGQTDCELTSKGKKQAENLGKRLKHEKIDKIYVSDLRRVIDTAAHIANHHPHAEIIYEPKLREVNYGIYEGKHYGVEMRAATRLGIPYVEYKWPGGESIKEMKNRVKKFFIRTLEKDKGKTIVIATHGGPITNILIYIFKRPENEYWKYLPKNTAVSIIDFHKNGSHTVQALNCIKHLKK